MQVRNTLLTLTLMAALGLAPTAQAFTLEEAIAKIDSMMAEMTQLKTQLVALDTSTSAPAPQVQGVQSGDILTLSLAYGETNEDIARVQRLLATDPTIYPYGVDSGFFGPKTQEAVRNFQARFNLDTVGVIGPSTKALLEVFMAAYPNENYPANVLTDTVPTQTPDPAPTAAADTSSDSSSTVSSGNKYRTIDVDEDDDEYIVRSYFANGDRNRDVIVYPDSASELREMIAKKLGTTESEVDRLVDIADVFSGSGSSRGDADEDDAEDAIDDADDALDKVRDLLEEAEDDDVDIDDAEELYDEARELLEEAEEALDDEDYDEAVEKAEEAEDMADEVEDELDEAEDDAEEIDEIRVEVGDGESEVEVEYANGDEDSFDVDEDDRDDIIEAIADELDIDEDEVEDVIEFDYGDIDRVEIVIEDDGARVRVYFESGADVKFTTDETDEDDIIEAVADEFDLDEDDVERYADVDDQR